MTANEGIRDDMSDERNRMARACIQGTWSETPQSVPAVTVYSRSGCGYCASARALLERRGIAFVERSLDADPGFRGTLRRTTGGTTVPQIVINGRPVGGASDLARLDRRGVLDPLAAGLPFPRAVVRRRLEPARLLGHLIGRRRSRWLYESVVVDERGTVLSRHPAADEDDARSSVAALNAQAGTR